MWWVGELTQLVWVDQDIRRGAFWEVWHSLYDGDGDAPLVVLRILSVGVH